VVLWVQPLAPLSGANSLAKSFGQSFADSFGPAFERSAQNFIPVQMEQQRVKREEEQVRTAQELMGGINEGAGEGMGDMREASELGALSQFMQQFSQEESAFQQDKMGGFQILQDLSTLMDEPDGIRRPMIKEQIKRMRGQGVSILPEAEQILMNMKGDEGKMFMDILANNAAGDPSFGMNTLMETLSNPDAFKQAIIPAGQEMQQNLTDQQNVESGQGLTPAQRKMAGVNKQIQNDIRANQARLQAETRKLQNLMKAAQSPAIKSQRALDIVQGQVEAQQKVIEDIQKDTQSKMDKLNANTMGEASIERRAEVTQSQDERQLAALVESGAIDQDTADILTLSRLTRSAYGDPGQTAEIYTGAQLNGQPGFENLDPNVTVQTLRNDRGEITSVSIIDRPEPDRANRQRKIESRKVEYMNYDMTEEEANALAVKSVDGRIETEFLQNGVLRITDLDMAEAGMVDNAVREFILPSGAGREPIPRSQTLYEQANLGTGPKSSVQAMMAKGASMLGMDLPYEQTVEARKGLELSFNTLVRTLTVSPRMAVYDIARVKKEFDIGPSFFRGPGETRANMRQLRNTLTTWQQQNERDTMDQTLPMEDRKVARADSVSIQNFLDSLGIPPEIKPEELKSPEVVETFDLQDLKNFVSLPDDNFNSLPVEVQDAIIERLRRGK
jgi:hypothetical protein